MKYPIDKLESALVELNEDQRNYLAQVIDELNIANKPKETIKEFIARLTGAKKEIFEQIEKSFEEREKDVFENVLKWFKSDSEYQHLSEDALILKTKYYIEMQKWNLFKAVNNYLAGLDITGVLNTLFRSTNNGFEGEWLLTLADGSTKDFSTKTIIAEGLIQRAHYRYLVNLK